MDPVTFIRLSTFLGLLVVFSWLESRWPRRRNEPSWMRRIDNLMHAVLGTVLLRLVLPWLAIDVAGYASRSSIGLFNLVSWPFWAEVALAVVLLDCAIYFQHRLFHIWPAAWRLHRVHHLDKQLDASTGVRFHPLEILVSMVIKIGVVVILGTPALAVLIFEVVLNATSLFNHANLRLPPALDRGLRAVLVTPDMHRIHHSVLPSEQMSNFGFSLSFWDRLFSTYRAAPRDGQKEMLLGLAEFRGTQVSRLFPMLLEPFRRQRVTNGSD